jgi:hypothetical protein
MTDGESARFRRNTPKASRAELMTDGAIRCRLLFTVSRVWFALPDDTLRVQRPTAPV